jgi:hypothetical protein
MHGLDRFASLGAAAHIGLVRDDDEEEVRCFEPSATSCCIFVQFEILDTNRRIWLTVPDDDAIKYTVPIQKDGAWRSPPPGSRPGGALRGLR